MSGTPLIDPTTNNVLKTTDVPENQSKNFVYPRTIPAVVSGKTTTTQDLKNTFAQWVVIHLPKSLTASNFGAVDPISGDTFIALSRVCVHLWCLCDYNPSSELIVCPCHQSEYVPGFGQPYNAPPGAAIAGPASKQPAPNNTLPMLALSIAQDGSIYITGVIGSVGCGQDCNPLTSSTTTTYNSA
ncbi:MAG: Rieske 2Fe-2S domain-containing protein [Thaumarchaeota archaeon]|nr:Rieske 2Fe-2S domain-containing protein [Nitrososphaerota archaeon]MCL5067595.1 Rieske 2Fe-2S domain-containing protein [Nitrososphaerota archaeon]